MTRDIRELYLHKSKTKNLFLKKLNIKQFSKNRNK